ncbi:MAG: response regulator [Planctomycetes bacterium]|nr:response regulator [Planctomycetota bacterium]
MFKILVAEDHEVNQQLFKTILEKIGYRVDLADDGAKALQMTGRETYHLIFMDIQMPNMNGYEAAKAIRARGIKTPIIAVTANALKEEVKKYFEAGMNDYLTKPFKKKDLLPVLQKWLDVSAIETSGPVQEETDPVFDYRKAVETFMGREDVVKRVLGSFVEKVENQLKTIGSALDSEDFEAVRIEAHSIKGGSWNLGAKRLGDAAKSLEEAGREKLRQEARKHLEELGVAFERFREVVIPIIGRAVTYGSSGIV